jgi:hypothetical protein
LRGEVGHGERGAFALAVDIDAHAGRRRGESVRHFDRVEKPDLVFGQHVACHERFVNAAEERITAAVARRAERADIEWPA